MARYNSINTTSSVAGGNSITTPYSGLLTTLTGSGTVTVPNPVYYTGQIQTFYNSTLSAITLSTPSGNFIAPGFTSATTLSLPSASVFTVVSDGTNYIVQDWLGGIGSFTSLSASGGTVTLNGTTTGSIDNVIIGGTTAKAGTFNGLTNTAGTTSLAGGSASGVFSFTSNQASTAYNNGAIVVTGGAGIAGALYVNSPSYFSAAGGIGTGTTTANSAYPLTLQRFVGSSGNLILQGDDTVVGAPVINFTNTRTSTSGTINFDGTTFTIRTGTVSTPRGGTNTKVFFVNSGTSVGSNYVEIQAPATSSSDILFSSSNSSGYGIVRYDNATNSMQLWANGTQIVTVGANGLGSNLGATLPAYPLHIAGKAWINNNSGDTGTRSNGLTVSINSGANYSAGTDPGDTARALSIIAGGTASYPAILGFRNSYTGNGAQQMVDLVMDPNANKFYVSKPGTTPWLSFSNTTHDMNTSRGFRNFTKSHSAVNTNAGAYSTQTTNITQIDDNTYTYSYYFYANTGGYPSCPYSYWVLCPVQKQNTGNFAQAQIEFWGVHRGMWGTSYSEYGKIMVGSSSDGGGVIVQQWQNGDANDSSNRVRVCYMDYNGTFVENGPWNTGIGLAAYTGNTIGNSYYKMPIFLKIYTNCGADKEYLIRVTTSDPTVLGPPYNGATVLTPNTAPTSGNYW